MEIFSYLNSDVSFFNQLQFKMSHVPKWNAEFAIKDRNECAVKKQEQKAMRAERYKARTDRAAVIAEKTY